MGKVIKCKYCSRPGHVIYHEEGKCITRRRNGEGTHIIMPDDERPIEKADKWLKSTGFEPKGAENWI